MKQDLQDDYDFVEDFDEFLGSATFVAALEDARARSQLLEGLVKQRKASGLSQKRVAKHMETTQSFISELENGRTDPHLSTLQRYARAVAARLSVKIELPAECSWQTWSASETRVRSGTLATEAQQQLNYVDWLEGSSKPLRSISPTPRRTQLVAR
jgi:transcriptional regulator with XRE-family HTH domain